MFAAIQCRLSGAGRYCPAVPLFEIKGPSDLAPFRTLRGGAELYESEIEDLVWANPDELLG